MAAREFGEQNVRRLSGGRGRAGGARGEGGGARTCGDYEWYLYGGWSVAKKLEATLSIARANAPQADHTSPLILPLVRELRVLETD